MSRPPVSLSVASARFARRGAACVVFSWFSVLSCHGPLPGDPSRALPGRIQLSGSQQSAIVGTAMTTPPSLQVWSRVGEPMPNLRVVFAVTGGGGAVTAATVSTDLDGVAAVGSWQAGPNALTATVSEVDTGIVFTASGALLPRLTSRMILMKDAEYFRRRCA